MESTSKETVKKFNKRAYLKEKLKTNFGSRQEGRGRAFIQKNAIVQRYLRQQRKDEERQRKRNQHVQSMEGEDQIRGLQLHSKSNPLMKTVVKDKSLSSQRSWKKPSSWERAKGEYQKKVAEKERMKQEALERKKEIEEAKRKYREKRLRHFKKLNQKTKKGQPVMRGRIEIMLEKLQESMT